jgi:hypothetical protein
LGTNWGRVEEGRNRNPRRSEREGRKAAGILLSQPLGLSTQLLSFLTGRCVVGGFFPIICPWEPGRFRGLAEGTVELIPCTAATNDSFSQALMVNLGSDRFIRQASAACYRTLA